MTYNNASHSTNPKLSFDKGTICIRDSRLVRIPNTKYDDKNQVLRSYAMNYQDIVEYLEKSDIDFVDNAQDFIPSRTLQIRDLELRDYQKQATGNWKKASMRGCVVLPTGAGKTAIGIKAIQMADASSLIIVPTIDLMEQWAENISKHLFIDNSSNTDRNKDNGSHNNNDSNNNNNNNDNSNLAQTLAIGRLGGGDEDIQAITITTYDSAYLKASNLGNKFKLIIFDEVHHLPAQGYRTIAEQFISPYRLGLTATIQREDQLHELIPSLVGGIVFETDSKDLSAQSYLAEHVIDRIQVNLTSSEQIEYDTNYTKFLTSLKQLGFKGGPSFYNLKQLIMISNKNKVARQAILAKNKANEIALNSQAKMEKLQTILEEKDNHTKTIIFTQNNKMVYNISNRFLIPFITYKTTKDERRDVLRGFKTDRYNAVVTSKVLDEGVDVPDVELGIIISGTGSKREVIQRLGRLLRPKHDGRKAKLVELVSSHTHETRTSAKRMSALRENNSKTTTIKEVKQT